MTTASCVLVSGVLLFTGCVDFQDPVKPPPEDSTPPSVIADLRGEALSGRRVRLTWSAPGDDGMEGRAAAYEVRHSASPLAPASFEGGTLVTGVPEPAAARSEEELVLGDLPEDELVHFMVRAVDDASKGSFSNGVAVWTLDETPPLPPVALDVEVVPAGNALLLSWTEPDRPADGDAVRLRLLRRVGGPATTEDMVVYEAPAGAPGQRGSFTDRGLADGVEVDYLLVALDSSADPDHPTPNMIEGPQTAAIPSDTEPPHPVTELVATPAADQSSVTLGYNPPEDEDFVGVRILRYPGADPEHLPVEQGEELATQWRQHSFTDTRVAEGAYVYVVSALDEVHNASAPASAVVVVEPLGAAPPPATNLQLEDPGTGNRLLLRWQDPVTRRLAAVRILRRDDAVPRDCSDALAVTAEVQPGAQRYEDTQQLVDGHTYYYAVYARSANGACSPAVLAQGSSSDRTPPLPVEGLRAEALAEGNVVRLSWALPQDPDRVSVHLLRCPTPGGPRPDLASWIEVPLAPGAVSAEEPGRANGVRLHYGVFTADEVPNMAGVEIEVTPQDVLPPQPVPWAEALSEVEDGVVSLRWTPPPDADLVGVELAAGAGPCPLAGDGGGEGVFGVIGLFARERPAVATDVGLADLAQLCYRLVALDEVPNRSDPVYLDVTVRYDHDGDGVQEADGDCDDGSAAAAPGFVEVCDGADNDCDGATDDVTDPPGFVCVPPGEEQQGSPLAEVGRSEDEQRHSVTFTRFLLASATEVTRMQWLALMGSDPSAFDACGPDCPAQQLSWAQAVVFCNRLSAAEGLPPCYEDAQDGSPYDGDDAATLPAWPAGVDCPGYRLPTEAEWEHLARAGTDGAFWSGELLPDEQEGRATALDRVGWYLLDAAVDYAGCEDLSVQGGPACAGVLPVANKPANPWGLYDVHGNVAEWVWDSHADYGVEPLVDPLGPDQQAGLRIVRGGSYADPAVDCRAAARGQAPLETISPSVGLRVVRSVRTPPDEEL